MPPRLATLDLIRGVAVLGILAINIAGFAGPMASLTSPNLPHPVSAADEAAYAFSFLFFEGKMRALFSLLFGAGLVLFWERTEAAGRNGDALQTRRLFWLMLLGALHYLLLWWGDILFLYAVCGLAALLLRPLSDRALLAIALVLYYVWHIWGVLDAAAAIGAETAVRHGTATAGQAHLVKEWLEPVRDWATQEMHESTYGFFDLVKVKLQERPFWQIEMVSGNFSETLPLMLIGMVLYRRGFFTGTLSRRRLMAVGIVCTGAGLVLTALFLGWAWPRHFPAVTMHAALVWGLAMPHLLCGCGYAALLVIATPRLAPTALGRKLIAAGRMAFSNYVLSSLVMTFVFYGWGLGLFGKIGPARQWLFVLAGWGLMLAWSESWLRKFRRGPLEWLWRSLIERKALANHL
ncbi:membrane protein [Novosphingobium malaysiense]|uniref:Membrane protein n=1 Tax=Novosphingobium malaysiense TaxID=1348853 RepID=A0A0B1ZWU9_9SPHN|nr:membrane protein [Novosphingobium malaysiense]